MNFNGQPWPISFSIFRYACRYGERVKGFDLKICLTLLFHGKNKPNMSIAPNSEALSQVVLEHNFIGQYLLYETLVFRIIN